VWASWRRAADDVLLVGVGRIERLMRRTGLAQAISTTVKDDTLCDYIMDAHDSFLPFQWRVPL